MLPYETNDLCCSVGEASLKLLSKLPLSYPFEMFLAIAYYILWYKNVTHFLTSSFKRKRLHEMNMSSQLNDNITQANLTE